MYDKIHYKKKKLKKLLYYTLRFYESRIWKGHEGHSKYKRAFSALQWLASQLGRLW